MIQPVQATTRTLLARRSGALALAAALVACAGADDEAGPDFPAMTPVLQGEGAYRDLEYSPDGTRVTYSLQNAEGESIWVADADGSNAARIGPVSNYAVDPEWGPDGTWVSYASDLLNAPDVFIAPADGDGEARPLDPGPDIQSYPRPSPDGSVILFRGNRAGTSDLWALPVEGGEPRQLTSGPTEDYNGGWSPDGSMIAFNRIDQGRQTAWIYSVEDGSERQLSTEGYESFNGIGWSPDSREILVHSRRTGLLDIWAYPVDGGEPRQITRDIRTDNGGSYSPDGRWVAFHSERGGQDDVWVIPAAGGAASRVTDDPAEEFDIRWRPDGRGLTFARDENVSHVYALEPGGEARAITTGDEDRFLFDVSPDGEWIVHGIESAGNDDIHLTRVDGTESRPLVTSPVDDDAARWSPDGSTIAFLSNRGGDFNLFTIDVESGETMQLTTIPAQLPRWSPSGDRIAFVSVGEGSAPDLWVVPADGGEPARVTNGARAAPWIRWSPAGESLLYTGAQPGGVGSAVFRVPVDGGPPVQLTPDSVEEAWYPEWSPDGSAIAYTGFTGPETAFDIFVADADGTDHRRLTEYPAWETGPRWSPDGSELYFMTQEGGETDEGGDWDIGVVPVDDGEPRIVLATPEDERWFQWAGDLLLFTRVPLGNEFVTVDVGALIER